MKQLSEWLHVEKILLFWRKQWELFKKDLELFIIPILLFSILLILYGINLSLKVKTNSFSLNQTPPIILHPYPLVSSLSQPQLSAKAAIILDSDSQVAFYKKNPQFHFSMASTTKIMTALVGTEYYKPNDILEVKTATVEGSILGINLGEKFTFESLLYAMFLPSANDAAYTIADNYPGGRTAFVADMNEKAASLHLTDTHYTDPAGLDDDGDYTTVSDLARLASIVNKQPLLSEIAATKQRVITDITGTQIYPLFNLNKLLGENGVTGLKTGTTQGAGQVLITSADVKGHTYIIVVMQSEDRYADTQLLLTYLQNVKYIDPLHSF